MIKKYYDKRKFLQIVVNNLGLRKPVYIAETMKGYTAKFEKSHKVISTVKSNPEAFAVKLAKRGHRTVSFRD